MSKLFNLKSATVLGALALAGVLAPTSQAAAEGRWCAENGGRSGYTNCGYHTFRQCVAAIRGVGGHCRPNPYIVTYDVEDVPVRVYPRVYVY